LKTYFRAPSYFFDARRYSWLIHVLPTTSQESATSALGTSSSLQNDIVSYMCMLLLGYLCFRALSACTARRCVFVCVCWCRYIYSSLTISTSDQPCLI
jgi:hypothetical protein